MDPLSIFHPIVREWFEGTFAAPTEAQALGWPAIAEGRHTLISAPTGSGKTLAAFLICIDRLLRAAVEGESIDTAQVVYISPLKALSNDVHKNLSVPLEEISNLALKKGITIPEIRIALRTGDTPAHERRIRARKPPHIWITTPESFYILLTSASGRRGLSGVHTVILDEIHAVAGNKRGSHLSLSVERLCALTGRPVTRIGLSATQHPIEEVARFLVGSAEIDRDGVPRCKIVDTGHSRKMDVGIEMPGGELGPIATNELWDETVSHIADLVLKQRTTLVFVNTRRLVERVAYMLSQKIGEEHVVAHHGSLSRKSRLRAEELLKNAGVKVCVATASLELGIDIGAVDLVCQIGSPRSISVLLQRVGRSGHWAGGIAAGRLFPLTRDELIECAALLLAIRKSELDRLSIPKWPLDILSQQIVAMCSAEDWDVDKLFRTVCRAYPYRELPRAYFDSIVHMLSEGVTSQLGRKSSYLHHNRIDGVLHARRGARLAAITSGGAIPDNADYEVIAEPDGIRVGTVYEDFAVESMAGDVFLLGNTAWRIQRIERGRLRVEDAHGQAPNIPFWIGEAPARTHELSQLISEVRQGIDERMSDRRRCIDWLVGEIGLSSAAADQMFEYMAEGKRVLGIVPTAEYVAAERFFDETGGMQLVLHAPFGGRINRALGLAVRKRFSQSFGAELQASATDDGVNLSLEAQHSFPLNDLLQYLRPHKIEETLVQAVLGSPIFITRWRWVLTRSLALLRFTGGRRVPAPIQRMRSEDMLAAILPVLAQYRDNLTLKLTQLTKNPLIFETLRDCLCDALDLDGLRAVLERIEREEILFTAKDTPMPCVFAHQILNAMPYAFLDDAPLEERRARAVVLRRVLPENTAELGKLDPQAIRSAAEDAWPLARDIEELHDLLIGLVLFPEDQSSRLPGEAVQWFESLVCAGRAFRIEGAGKSYWAAAEAAAAVLRIPGLRRIEDGTAGRAVPDAIFYAEDQASQNPYVPLVRGWIEAGGPVTAAELARLLGFTTEDIHAAFLQLESEGLVLRGMFSEKGEEEFCSRRILARIHRSTIAHLRREIEPVSTATFLRFLFQWQHVAEEAKLSGERGVLEIIDQLQGFETAAVAWESEILRARIRDYKPEFLDSLCMMGDVVWGRWMRRATQAEVPARRPGLTRTAVLGLGLREDMSWLIDVAPADETALSIPARSVLAFLRHRGASFFSEIVAGVRHLPSEIEEALWQLVSAGLVTADSFTALRSLVTGEAKHTVRPSRRRRRRQRRTREGRWSLLEPVGSVPENRVTLWAQQYLRRYGILCRELLVREPSAPQWRELLYELRRSEARGEIRGGRFIAGLGGEQFAMPEAVSALRALNRSEPQGLYSRISACDPLNLAGILTPGPRIAATAGNRIVVRDGVAIAAIEGGESRMLASIEASERKTLERLLDPRP
jgi:ATP-dependent Lhr-like helicase